MCATTLHAQHSETTTYAREKEKNAILKWNKAFAEGHKSFKVKKLPLSSAALGINEMQ